MRHILLVSLLFASLSASNAAAPTGTDARTQELIHVLGLKPLPKESGYLGLIGSSAQKIDVHGESIAVQSQVYYMLTRERPIIICIGWSRTTRTFSSRAARWTTSSFIPMGAWRRSRWAAMWLQASGRWWLCPAVAGRHCGYTPARAMH